MSHFRAPDNANRDAGKLSKEFRRGTRSAHKSKVRSTMQDLARKLDLKAQHLPCGMTGIDYLYRS